ncbi:hypothetical protein B0T16DRAFT_49452 [Cercophora newfieldiana]|uniref:Uncharacterized protein n=1 Tax=Cercophora newfieldiana TaxID=92897 RepID=A0AA39YQU9_9PEZI|nr:hypothetical protein B0T16DRAFT_49452 [Cercophora newfieldiana]
MEKSDILLAAGLFVPFILLMALTCANFYQAHKAQARRLGTDLEPSQEPWGEGNGPHIPHNNGLLPPTVWPSIPIPPPA